MSVILNSSSLSYQTTAFTLVELLITITLLTILLTLATPSFKTILMNNRILAEADALTNSLNFARNTALTQNITVITCPFSAPGSAACGGNWQKGWVVATQPPPGTTTLLHAFTTGTNVAVLSASTASVIFDSRGITTTQTNFTLCDSRGATFALSIEVLPTGYVQSSSAPGIAVWNGGALTCP